MTERSDSATIIAGAAEDPAPRSPVKPQVPGAADPVAVREWAKSQGIEVKDRGRVPTELVVKFKAATAQ